MGRLSVQGRPLGTSQAQRVGRLRWPARLVAAGAALAFILGGCATADPSPSVSSAPPAVPSSAPSAASGRPILVDTDVAPDDVMALAYLVARTDLDLVAVTVSGTGEARCPDGVRVVRAVLERLGRTDIPVACGRDTPLVGDHAFPAPWRDAVATGFLLDLPEPTGAETDLDAVGLLVQTARDAGGALEVLTLGPLTNLGDALATDPSLAERLAGITIMGGAVLTGGNVGAPDGDGLSVNAEWNAHVDPHALAVVLAAGAPVTLVPLDATDDVPMTRGLALRIAANRGTESARLVYELVSRNPERLAGTSLWDQTAAILLAEGPDGLTLERLPLAVVEEEGRDAGRTEVAADGVDTTVATAADEAVVTRRFVEGLGGGAAEAPLPEPVATIEVAFDGPRCTVTAPDPLPAGFVRLTFRNSYEGDAGAFVAGFYGDGSWDALLALAARGPLMDIPPGVIGVLSVPATPGGSGEDVAPLDAGSYGVICGMVTDAGLGIVPGKEIAVAP